MNQSMIMTQPEKGRGAEERKQPFLAPEPLGRENWVGVSLGGVHVGEMTQMLFSKSFLAPLS